MSESLGRISLDDLRSRYRLKEELAAWCREAGLATGGSKAELLDRIEAFLKTGGAKAAGKQEKAKLKREPRAGSPKRAASTQAPRRGRLELDAPIALDYTSDEEHRRFFIEAIGPRFKFNVAFMTWMKEYRGKRSYREAVMEWLRIEAAKKAGKKTEIASQFEYNRYTRDFFEDNPGASRADCIRCWNYKKGVDGNHRYEREDLEYCHIESR